MRRIVIALVAIVALGAAIAPVSRADVFATEASPANLTGSQAFSNLITAGAAGGTTECSTVTYQGMMAATPTTTIAVTPTYSGCKTMGLTSTVDVNECDYLFHIGAATTGTMDVRCPAGKEITITVNPVAPKCTIHIPAQTGLGTVTYSTVGTGSTREVHFAMNVSGLTTNATAGSGVGACATFHVVTSKFDGIISITAEKTPGTTHLGIFLQ